MRAGRGLIRKVVVGISGGVDSAVAALILKKRGYEVSGLFMKNWDIADETGECTADIDREHAKYVCNYLRIPFHEVNFVKEYWNSVFSSLIEDYQNGVTPNPDILCNKHIKFDAFLDHARRSLGADAIATGHYARTNVGYDLRPAARAKSVQLLCALDPIKDQTFFLAQISQHALQRTLFPIGELTKDFVKRMAMHAGMERIAKRKESMGICFIGSRNFQKFIGEYVEPKKGNFVHVETGEVLATHNGLHMWTLGQRANIAGHSTAFFIVEKNLHNQDIIVAPGTDHPALFCLEARTGPAHWISGTPPPLLQGQTTPLKFRFQHKHPLVGCSVTMKEDNSLVISLDQPMRALTPGQYAVLYQGDVCLGSAKITKPGPSLYSLNCKDRVVQPKEFS